MAGDDCPECICKRNSWRADVKKSYVCTKQLTSSKIGHEFIQPVNLKKQVSSGFYVYLKLEKCKYKQIWLQLTYLN